MSNSISQVAQKSSAPASDAFKIIKKVVCKALTGKEYPDGRECTIKRLNAREQLSLLGRVRDGVLHDRKMRGDNVPDVPQSDAESEQFWESIHLLVLGCVEPTFSLEEATAWMTSDLIADIPCADVVQFLLHNIRSFNDTAPGMEEIAAGLATFQKMPQALQVLETAWMKNDNSIDLLLNGKVPGTQEEMLQYIEQWGAIITYVAFSVLRKQARIEAEETADKTSEAILDKFCELAARVGFLKHEPQSPSGEENTEADNSTEYENGQ